MKINMNGEPDDPIRKLDNCEHCIFEEILSDKQRKIKVLDLDNTENHIHRIVVEQLCGKHYDKVCPMKYAAMKTSVDDRTATQMGVVNHYLWDLGKNQKKKLKFEDAMTDWLSVKDLGRGLEESYANRFDIIYDFGIRRVEIGRDIIEKQILTSDAIYEIVISDAKLYNKWIEILFELLQKHNERYKK